MALDEELEQEPGCLLVAAEVSDEDGRIEQVQAQADVSVRRELRTQSAAAARSLQCP